MFLYIFLYFHGHQQQLNVLLFLQIVAPAPLTKFGFYIISIKYDMF